MYENNHQTTIYPSWTEDRQKVYNSVIAELEKEYDNISQNNEIIWKNIKMKVAEKYLKILHNSQIDSNIIIKNNITVKDFNENTQVDLQMRVKTIPAISGGWRASILMK